MASNPQRDDEQPAAPANGDPRQTECGSAQIWQPRKVLEMNVYLLRNKGLDLQRWFEREIQTLKGAQLRNRHA